MQMLAATNHLAHDFCHQRLSLVGCLLHFLVTYLHRSVLKSEVGDDAYAECAYSAVVCHNHLRHCTHADGIGSETMIHLVFGWCLESRTLYSDIYAMHNPYSLFLGNLVCLGNQTEVVGLVHIRETWTCGEILSTQRMLGEEVDVVGDDHEVANLELGIHTARGIADEECLDAKLVHHSDGERNLLHRVALIVMEATLHSHDVLTTEFAEDKLSGMSLDCRNREVGYLGIRELVGVSYF